MTALETDNAVLPDGVWVERVPTDAARRRAAQRLVEHARPGDKDAGRLFLANTKAAGISLEHFFASFQDGAASHGEGCPPAREATLIVLGSGRTALVFPSLPDSADREGELGAVAAYGLAGLRPHEDGGPALAQALLLPGEKASGRGLERGGFSRLAELAYLRKTPLRSSERLPVYERGMVEGVEVLRASEIGADDRDDVLIRALEASYEDTLDCPELQALRETSDVLDSHKATGLYDRALWWVVFDGPDPAGVMLLSVLESKTEAELVYMGLGPSVRGKGLAKRLLGTGIAALRRRGVGALSCAVDLRNEPALALYRSLGMRPFAQRLAFVRDLRG